MSTTWKRDDEMKLEKNLLFKIFFSLRDRTRHDAHANSRVDNTNIFDLAYLDCFICVRRLHSSLQKLDCRTTSSSVLWVWVLKYLFNQKYWSTDPAQTILTKPNIPRASHPNNKTPRPQESSVRSRSQCALSTGKSPQFF